MNPDPWRRTTVARIWLQQANQLVKPPFSMKSLAVIPARGGSQRIPRKNIKSFHGQPIIAYAVEAALQSRLFERVIVSTDDETIAEVARQWGAEAPFPRSDASSDDHAPIAQAVIEVLDEPEIRERRFDLVCCLFATAPFLTPELVIRGRDAIDKQGCDSMIAVQRFPYPVERALRLDESGNLGMVSPAHRKTRSQDLRPTFHDAGLMYWTKVSALMRYRRFLTPHAGALEVDRLQALDIDTPEDWAAAETLWSCRQVSRQAA